MVIFYVAAGVFVWSALMFLAGLQVQVRSLDRRENALAREIHARNGEGGVSHPQLPAPPQAALLHVYVPEQVQAQATLNGTPYFGR